MGRQLICRNLPVTTCLVPFIYVITILGLRHRAFTLPMQIFDKSEIILSSLVSSRCSEIPDHGVAHLGRVEVGFLNKLHDNRKELVATLKPRVYL